MNTPTNTAPLAGKRKTLLLSFALLVGIGVISALVWWTFWGSQYEDTDDAYVEGDVVQLTPQIGGTVAKVLVQDTDRVKAGQVLVQLDPADAQLALDQARAQAGTTFGEVRRLYANNAVFAANIDVHKATVARLTSELARVQGDWARRKKLFDTGAISEEASHHAEQAFITAQSQVEAAKAELYASLKQQQASLALTEGAALEHHPALLHAKALVAQAELGLSRTNIVAPINGMIAKRSVQVGTKLAAGTPLMSVIALDDVWVNANFKEAQLRHMRVGQRVELFADIYGKDVKYQGEVVGIGAGTGSAFALIPAQNASGNWIKIVQRVPVRIRLDRQQLQQHPLRIGLSMFAKVHTADDVPEGNSQSK